MKLLVVEDEEKMASMLARGLGEEGHQVDLCAGGRAALEQAQAIAYDVVILDWALPDMDGVAVLREWRARGLNTPVLLLTARGTTGEKVTGLRAGADDYLTKPFDFGELLARIEALHRRGAGREVQQIGPLVLDPRRRVLTAGERSESLTAREFALLSELVSHLGDVVTRSRIIDAVWGNAFDGNPNIVDVYIGYLRAKIERFVESGVSIQAVRGVGFKLVAPRPGGRG